MARSINPTATAVATAEEARQAVTYDDGVTCSACWGIVPPDGVQMVPDDGAVCRCRAEILVYAWVSHGGAGGYQWAQTQAQTATEEVRRMYVEDYITGSVELGRLATLQVAWYLSPEEVSDFIEGELQDSIAVGAVGRSINYDLARDAA